MLRLLLLLAIAPATPPVWGFFFGSDDVETTTNPGNPATTVWSARSSKQDEDGVRTLTLQVGGTAVLSCVQPNARRALWVRDNSKTIAMSNILFGSKTKFKVEIEERGTNNLTIRELQAADSGFYTCIDRKKHHKPIVFKLVVIEGLLGSGNRKISIEGPSFVEEGSTLRLVCKTEDTTGATWWRGNKMVNNGTRLSTRFGQSVTTITTHVSVRQNLLTTTLQITKVDKRRHSGRYDCLDFHRGASDKSVSVLSIPVDSRGEPEPQSESIPAAVPEAEAEAEGVSEDESEYIPQHKTNTPFFSTETLKYPEGSTVIINCSNASSAGQVITWKRWRNHRPLTLSINSERFVSDRRFSVQRRNNDWRLKIVNLQAADSGVYSCFSRVGAFEITQRNVTLLVTEPAPSPRPAHGLSFDSPTANVTVSENATAVLPCSIWNIGDHNVVWTDQTSTLLTYEDRRIVDDRRMSVERPSSKAWNLHIREVRWLDRGMYYCQVNTKPVSIKFVYLDVQVPAKIIDSLSTGNLTTIEGETLTLVCNATGIPYPNVTWYWRGEEYVKEVGKGEVFVIHNITRSNHGVYQCVADNGVEPAASRQSQVLVQFAPEISIPNKLIRQLRGKDTILECEVTAFPRPIIMWKKNGRLIRNSSKFRQEVYSESDNKFIMSLLVNSLEKSDFGNYTCVASTPTLGPRVNKTVAVYELDPWPKTFSVNVTVRVGDTAVLPCDGRPEDPSQMQVVWIDPHQVALTYKDRRIVDDARFSVERPFLKDWNLHIRDVTMGDRGTYTCNINNHTKMIYLDVQEYESERETDSTYAQHENANNTIKYPTGVTAYLSCGKNSALEAQSVNWMINDGRESRFLTLGESVWTRDSRISVLRERNDYILVIRNVNPTDSGKYVCVTVMSTVKRTLKNITLLVTDSEDFYPLIEYPQGYTANISCGNSSLFERFSWSFRGKQLSINRRITANRRKYSVYRGKYTWKLSIRNVTAADSGVYRCVIEGSDGSRSRNVTLYIKDKRHSSWDRSTTDYRGNYNWYKSTLGYRRNYNWDESTPDYRRNYNWDESTPGYRRNYNWDESTPDYRRNYTWDESTPDYRRNYTWDESPPDYRGFNHWDESTPDYRRNYKWDASTRNYRRNYNWDESTPDYRRNYKWDESTPDYRRNYNWDESTPDYRRNYNWDASTPEFARNYNWGDSKQEKKEATSGNSLADRLLQARVDHPQVYAMPRNASSGGPLVVAVDMQLINILNSRRKSAEVEMSAWIHLQWRDQSLSWDPEMYGNVTSITLPRDAIWTPDIAPYRRYVHPGPRLVDSGRHCPRPACIDRHRGPVPLLRRLKLRGALHQRDPARGHLRLLP